MSHGTVKAKVRVVAKNELSRAGLIVMGLDYSALMLQVQNGKFMLFNTTCKNAVNGQPEDTDILQSFVPDKEYNTGSTNSTEISLYLQVRIDKEGKCRFGYSKDGKKYRELNGTFQAREGRWIGAKMGLVAAQVSGAPKLRPMLKHALMNPARRATAIPFPKLKSLTAFFFLYIV